MDTHFIPGDNTGEPRPRRVDRRHFSSIGTQNLSLRDRFELDRPRPSHGDDNHKARNHLPVSSGNNLKQRTRRVNAADNDELVKHMSNLPSYLEQAGKPQEKAFSVGVLDWGLLEKWESNKHVPYRSDESSSSNSNSSSLFSTEESSTFSQTGHSSAASHHRDHRFPSEASTADGKSRNVSKQQPYSRAESIMKETASSSKTEHLGAHDLSFFSKGQHHNDLEKQARRSRRSQSLSLNHKSTEKDEKPVLVRPVDDCSTVSVTKGLKATNRQRNLEENERNCTEKSSRAHFSELKCDIPHSCPLPCDVNDQKIRVLRPCRSQEARTNDNATTEGSQQCSTGKLISPSKEGSSKETHRVIQTELPTVADLPQGSRISKRPVDVVNARHPSPTGRISLRIGNADGGRARSSPLKRLLEPLLKPREAIKNRSTSSLKKDSKPVTSASKILDRPSTAPGIRVGLNLNSEKSTSILKPESTVIQAVLQLVVQNGCPLFTFAVDSVKDILCAAVSKLGSDKSSGDRYLYAFFSIQEIKNRNWMNLRGKGSGHEYNPNVFAQMEVSETRLSKSTGSYFLRQFVLSTVDVKPGEKSESEYQLNDELAALVVCLPIPGETDEKMQLDKYNVTTVILPGGIHTLPSEGKLSSLIERWRSGGQCDCGGWDPGCKLRILNDSNWQPSSSVKFKLYDRGGDEGKQQPILCVAPFKDKEGILSISFSPSISPLQAFSICLAVLDSRKLLRPPTPAKVQDAKSSDQTSPDEVPGSYFSVPPRSPVGRV